MDFFGTDIYEKCAGILPSPVPSFKAFALPTCRERTTQKAHADMYTTRPSSADGRNGTWIYTPRGRHWLPSVLPTGQKLRSFETRKPDACKRLLHIICTYSSPTLGPSVELCATNIQKKLCGRGFHAFFSASLFLFVKGMPWLLCDASFCPPVECGWHVCSGKPREARGHACPVEFRRQGTAGCPVDKFNKPGLPGRPKRRDELNDFQRLERRGFSSGDSHFFLKREIFFLQAGNFRLS